jgi:hypothetical protein
VLVDNNEASSNLESVDPDDGPYCRMLSNPPSVPTYASNEGAFRQPQPPLEARRPPLVRVV